MKRTFFFGAVLLTISAAMTVPAALFGWTKTTHDFGRIARGKSVTAEFTFTNRGEQPLVISQAKGSCGCTGVDYPRAAVLPGAAGVIRATFNAAAAGAFHKSVTVESNAEGGAVVLHLKGEVTSETTNAQ